MIKTEDENSLGDTLSEENNKILTKVKELLNTTKECLQKNPQHPLHLELKKEMLDLQLNIDINGTVNNRKYIFKINYLNAFSFFFFFFFFFLISLHT
jgi:hypothetical protein